MNHTPTPYVAVEVNENSPLPCGVIIAIHRKDEPWKKEGAICEMMAQGKDGKYNHGLTDDTAAFIVEACNSHERLKRERSALKEVANAITVAYRIGAISGKLAKSTFELAESAIALCDGPRANLSQ